MLKGIFWKPGINVLTTTIIHLEQVKFGAILIQRNEANVKKNCS